MGEYDEVLSAWDMQVKTIRERRAREDAEREKLMLDEDVRLAP